MQTRWPIRVLSCLMVCIGMARVPTDAAPLYAFTSDRDGELDIFVMEEGGGVRNVTRVSFGDYPAYWGCAIPAWSPDGMEIAFKSDRTGVFQIYLMAPDGFDVRAITGHPEYCGDPTWSPDGTRLAFRTETDIRIVELDGTEVGRLDPGWTGSGDLVWSPDGRELAFDVLETGEGREIYSISVETGTVRPLTDRVGDFGLSWFPGGGKSTLVRSSSWGAIKLLVR